MCEQCYRVYGSPAPDDAARAAAPIIAKADNFGALHIAVEDWNLEDDNIAWLAGPENADHPRWNDDERAALKALQSLTLAQRAAALALVRGYI